MFDLKKKTIIRFHKTFMRKNKLTECYIEAIEFVQSLFRLEQWH